MEKALCYTAKMETINGAHIRLERLSDDELLNLKEHVLHKLDEVMEDHTLVMDEINKRNPETWQDPLDGFEAASTEVHSSNG